MAFLEDNGQKSGLQWIRGNGYQPFPFSGMEHPVIGKNLSVSSEYTYDKTALLGPGDPSGKADDASNTDYEILRYRQRQ